MGQTVLITGASGGLGAEFAGIFAAEGFDLVLTARQTDKMEKLASRLHEKYPVKITVLFSDLSRPDGAKILYEEISERGIRIDQLVNNAGAGKAGRTIDISPEILNDLINLNMVSVTMLCRLIGADMERQGYGKILNISSSAALFPDPWFNVYGPSKSFVLALTEAMRGELAGSGVTVTALCPGPIRTGWAENAGKAYPVIAADPRRPQSASHLLHKGRHLLSFSASGSFESSGRQLLAEGYDQEREKECSGSGQRALTRTGRQTAADHIHS